MRFNAHPMVANMMHSISKPKEVLRLATSANTFPELRPPSRFLLGPGPSNVHPRVMKAMLSPVLGHLDPEFVGIMEDIKKMLRLVFRTSNEITFPVSGTGSAGMECVMANLVEEGDDVVVGVNGAFGGRLAEVAHRLGARDSICPVPNTKYQVPVFFQFSKSDTNLTAQYYRLVFAM